MPMPVNCRKCYGKIQVVKFRIYLNKATQNKLYVLPQNFWEKLCAHAKKQHKLLKNTQNFFSVSWYLFLTELYVLKKERDKTKTFLTKTYLLPPKDL